MKLTKDLKNRANPKNFEVIITNNDSICYEYTLGVAALKVETPAFASAYFSLYTWRELSNPFQFILNPWKEDGSRNIVFLAWSFFLVIFIRSQENCDGSE